jgi:hypothetical protein
MTQLFISGLHLTNQFRRVKLDSTQILRWYESISERHPSPDKPVLYS